jgi:hypothetical protein
MTARHVAIVTVLALFAATAAPAPGIAQEPGEEAKAPSGTPLFNGEDLSGWTDALDNTSSWQVVDGVIEGRGGGAGQPGVLVTERDDFTNYRLRVEFQCLTPGGGAGIELRRASPGDNVVNCYWVSGTVHPNPDAKAKPPGGIVRCRNYRYGSARPPGRACKLVKAAAKRWHTLECQVEGNTITTWLNGVKVDELTDNKQPFESGAIALFCRGDSVVHIRKVSIEELSGKPDESAEKAQ